MSKFHEIIQIVLKHEGGYVNDPTDRGGETKFGISKRAHPNEDIKNLTREQAIEMYRRDYWIPSRAEQLPEQLQSLYFDMVVNHGQQNAVTILQRACKARDSRVKIDGLIGPQTIGVAQRVELDRLVSYRTLFFAYIIFRRPGQEKFWFGWFQRTVSFLKNG